MNIRTIISTLALATLFAATAVAQDADAKFTLDDATQLLVGAWEFNSQATRDRNGDTHPDLHDHFSGMVMRFEPQQFHLRLAGAASPAQPWRLEAGADPDHFTLHLLVDEEDNFETVEVLHIVDKNRIVLKPEDADELVLDRLDPNGFPKGPFHLTTKAAEHRNLVLESDPLALRKWSNASGMNWKALPMGDGYSLLTTEHLEEHRVVLGQDGGRGPAQMAHAEREPGMAWKAIPVGNGYYHLTTRLLEKEGKVLHGNVGQANADGDTPFEGVVPYMVDAETAGPGAEWKFLPRESPITPEAAGKLIIGNWQVNAAETAVRHGELDQDLADELARVTIEFTEGELTLRANDEVNAAMAYQLRETEGGGLGLVVKDGEGEEQQDVILILGNDRIMVKAGADVPPVVFDRIRGAVVEGVFHLQVPGSNAYMAFHNDDQTEQPDEGIGVSLVREGGSDATTDMTKLQVRPLIFTSEDGVKYVAYRVENDLSDSDETFWLAVSDDHRLRIAAGPKENPYGRFAFRSFEHRSIGNIHDVHAIEAVWVSDEGEPKLNHPTHYYFLTANDEGAVVSRDLGDINKAERTADTAWGLVPVKK